MNTQNEIDLKVNRIIAKLKLQPHPEGGFYKETFRSDINVTVDKKRYGKSEKAAGTSIYYLLRKNEFSAWHRVKSDEVWNYHSGSSVTIHMINSETGLYSQAIIGDIATDETAEPQFTVKANTWFAASVNDKESFSLVGCSVFPGFDFSDFELASATLMDTYPKLAHIIIKYMPVSLVHSIKEYSTEKSKHIAILGAMQQEVNKIIELMSEKEITTIADREYHSGYIGSYKATVVFSRWGKVAASSTVTTLITHFGCDCVIFTGVAGAVSDDLNIGDIVVADSTCQYDVDARPLFERFCIPLTNKLFFNPQEDLIQKALTAAKDFIASDELDSENFTQFSIKEPRVYKGLIVTGDQFITDATSHEAIQSLPKAVMAVEMEGAAVAQVCDEHQIPYIIVRTISDKADHSAKIDFIQFIEDIASQYSVGIIKRFLEQD